MSTLIIEPSWKVGEAKGKVKYEFVEIEDVILRPGLESVVIGWLYLSVASCVWVVLWKKRPSTDAQGCRKKFKRKTLQVTL